MRNSWYWEHSFGECCGNQMQWEVPRIYDEDDPNDLDLLIMGDIDSQLNNSYHQVRLPVVGLGCIQLNCWSEGPM